MHTILFVMGPLDLETVLLAPVGMTLVSLALVSKVYNIDTRIVHFFFTLRYYHGFVSHQENQPCEGDSFYFCCSDGCSS